ncbi:hypothetical protein GGD65_004545 [Bradyrhizobium sp. CIR18]|uniref:hypothetical protein n=1 Tax=Bradyrhizobium sp. CIR18 TaxID=2663839 RepID=UPI0016065277|nr:hypothetical protein [Bradyrhizobium sp. CIR18]MBB4363500.1 hypothetical protein [Bradyrhizobium sp. CIR18]
MVVVDDVKPALSLGGFVTVVVVVPQFLTLSAWAGDKQAPPTAVKVKAIPNSSVFRMLSSYSVIVLGAWFKPSVATRSPAALVRGWASVGLGLLTRVAATIAGGGLGSRRR